MKVLHLLIFVFILFTFIIEAAVARKKCFNKKCAKNEILRCNKCKDATCGEKEEAKVECVQICKPKQCRCKLGFFRYNGICIPQEKCPSKINMPDCKIDEFEHLQAKTFDEILTCRNLNKFFPPSSASKLDEKLRCVCEKGRVKNAKGKCIFPKDCTETDNNHVYERTSTINNTEENNNIDNDENKDYPTFFLENEKTTYPPKLLPKVPKSIDEKMPKIILVPPPPPQEI